MLSDLRLALRQLVKSRGFALIAILTLAVGIGSVTAIYTTLRALVVEPFDYPVADRIVHVWSGDRWPLSPADYLDLQEQSTSFEDFGVYSPQTFNVGAENALAANGVRSSAGVLRTFGVHPQRGRLFTAEDDAKDAPPVAIISHGLWQGYFGGDPDLVGKNIRLNGGDVTVVGIMPAGFEFAAPWMRTVDCKVWLPMSLEDNKETRGSHWLCGVARLKPGVTVEQADVEVKTIGKRLSELYPNSNFNKKFLVRSLHFEMTRDLGKHVWFLFAAVALVLLIACANVASMLLARSAQRQGEFGIRVALGATRRDMMRLAFAESVTLALLASLVGLLFAYGGIEALKAISPASEARKAAMALDGPVLLFAVGATFLTALLAGLPPVLASMNTSLAGVIREDARGAVGSRSRHFMLRSLIIAQVGVAFILANGAALFSASYFELLEENERLSTDEVLAASVSLQGALYEEEEDRVRFWELLVERLEALPGVSAAGITSKLPLEGGSNTNGLVNDEVYDPSQQRLLIERSSVTSDYFDAMGLTLLQGRGLQPEDAMVEGGLLGVVVNRAMVEKAWPDKDPIGEIIRANTEGDPWFTATVVGVVEDVKQWGADSEVQPEMFTLPKGHWGNRAHLVVRSSQPASYLTPLVRAVVADLDSELALENVRTLKQVVLDSTQGQRAMAGLVNFFTITALGLAAVGLYGTMSYHATNRTREFGVRMAIGAMQGDISRLVLRQGAVWVSIGLALGVAGIYALATVLQSLVYGMEGLTLQPLVLASVGILVASLIACWAPARRAARLDPLAALQGR